MDSRPGLHGGGAGMTGKGGRDWQRDSPTPLHYARNDILVGMPEGCRRFLGRRAGLKPASTGRGGRGEGWVPAPRLHGGRISTRGQRRWAGAHEGRPYGERDGSPHPRRTTEVGGRPRGTALRGEGWVPAYASTTEVGGPPTRDGPTGGGMGPRIREHNGGGRRPRGTALRGEGWNPASASTTEVGGRFANRPYGLMTT